MSIKKIFFSDRVLRQLFILKYAPVEFKEYKLKIEEVRNVLDDYSFTNGRPITKSMLAWWAFYNENQKLLNLDTKLQIEHIFARKRQENDKSLIDKNNLEALGNKSLLEESINIRASDYRFKDKKKYYKGFVTSSGKEKEGTRVNELLTIASNNSDFTEQDIINRTELIKNEFINYLKNNDLLLP